MRLDRVYIDGFKNLIDFEINFDEDRLTTVIIGQNGTGKSNLIEAITDVFRWVDLNRGEPRFRYEIEYRIGNRKIQLTNCNKRASIIVDGRTISRSVFERSKSEFFPDLVFGYYSGVSRRYEAMFDSHQRRYYSEIIKESSDQVLSTAFAERRLFFCRPIHGVLALLSFFAFPDTTIMNLLTEKLGVVGFHSALAHFKEPSWFTPNKWTREQGRRPSVTAGTRGQRSKSIPAQQAEDLWGATGMAGECARAIKDSAFLPLSLQDYVIDDYRAKQRAESQLACFIRNAAALNHFSSRYTSDQDMFAALEAVDISDLIRAFPVWVTRKNDKTGDIGFDDLSDGERQLLMVLGLIRISRGKRALFLLDEPDTHLNPIWQLTYLDLIREWTGIATDENKCHIVLTSHNPLTVAGLKRQDVHVIYRRPDNDEIEVDHPPVDPQGLGIAGVLRQIFGMPHTLDPETQRLVDQRNALLAQSQRDAGQEERLQELNQQIRALGISIQNQQDLFERFLKLVELNEQEGRTLTPHEIVEQNRAIVNAIGKLRSQNKAR